MSQSLFQKSSLLSSVRLFVRTFRLILPWVWRMLRVGITPERLEESMSKAYSSYVLTKLVQQALDQRKTSEKELKSLPTGELDAQSKNKLPI